MATQAQRFYGPNTPSASGVALCTPPVGRRWLIRNVSIVNLAAANAISVQVTFGGTGANNRVWAGSIPVGSSVILDPWWTLEAGETFRLTGQVTFCSVLVCGYDLTA